MKKLILAVGARPNFMKAAPLYDKLKKNPEQHLVFVHTGQHYDFEMSQIFFEDLNLPKPHYFLNVGSGSHAEQTGRIMMDFEDVLFKEKPDSVVVFGDVNSTIACCLAAHKLHIPVFHVEAGLRSYDRSMPEEINRKLTDLASDLLFTHCDDANNNLKKEGFRNIHFWDDLQTDSSSIFSPIPLVVNVGNVMIDSLKMIIGKIDSDFEMSVFKKHRFDYGEKSIRFGLVTLHRPDNVDKKESLQTIFQQLKTISKMIPLIFPLHTRTKQNMKKIGISIKSDDNLRLTKPLSYKEFVTVMKNATFVLTDSGGIQEETTYLQIPCLTLRPNTERPVTITSGTNRLVTVHDLERNVKSLLKTENKLFAETNIPLWDGNSSQRIAWIIQKYLALKPTS